MKSISRLSVQVNQTLEEAFPEVDPGLRPFGTLVLVQVRSTKNKVGSILLTDDTKETEKWNVQVAKVIAIGPLAFRSRSTGEFWPEGQWAKVGDFVRIPKYLPDKWEVPVEGTEEFSLFALCEDKDLRGKITCDPLKVLAFV